MAFTSDLVKIRAVPRGPYLKYIGFAGLLSAQLWMTLIGLSTGFTMIWWIVAPLTIPIILLSSVLITVSKVLYVTAGIPAMVRKDASPAVIWLVTVSFAATGFCMHGVLGIFLGIGMAIPPLLILFMPIILLLMLFNISLEIPGWYAYYISA